MIKYLKDKYLTWRTGYNKSGRAYIKWREETIVRSAYTIEDMFVNFKYIFPVSVDIFDHAEPFGWYPNEDFEQYMYPNREQCRIFLCPWIQGSAGWKILS